MAQRRQFHGKRKHPNRPSHAPTPVVAAVRPEKAAPVEYGKPFTILEDMEKNTFEYKSGAWVPYPMTIAECRQSCQVSELPQKVNRMTRYEIRCPLAAGV